MRFLKFLILLTLTYSLNGATSTTKEYIAFSTKVAQQIINSVPKGKDYQTVYPEVFSLGGINVVKGLVYDRKTQDIILVGHHDSTKAAITLDDFAVALRARFVYSEWPEVSIDPTEDTHGTQIQKVRFEGGLENTGFGEDLFQADYLLKKIGIGHLPAGINGFTNYWDLTAESSNEFPNNSHKISCRFWFYPIHPDITVRQDVVVLKGLKLGVFTEVLSAEIDGQIMKDLSTFQDKAAETYAKSVSENFARLARQHPPFSRLQGLAELVALTRAIEEMEEVSELTYWLENYQVRRIDTKRNVKALKRVEGYKVHIKGAVYGPIRELSGGVQLIMAIALRLKAGDASALKEAVLGTRPGPDVLKWTFLAARWIIPTSQAMLTIDNIAQLFSQAAFLQEKKYYDDAIILYNKIIELQPNWTDAYYNRALAFSAKGLYDKAVADLTQAIKINPNHFMIYLQRADAYEEKGLYEQALNDYDKVLELNPSSFEAYNNRGLICDQMSLYEQAITNFKKAIEIKPTEAKLYCNLGNTYANIGSYDKAISEFDKAIDINPKIAEAYNDRGTLYDERGLFNKAVSDYTKAIELKPEFAKAYYNLGIAYYERGLFEEAIFNYTEALSINKKDDNFYYNRGRAYTELGQHDQAISDYTKALEINPHKVEAYLSRGNSYAQKKLYDEAIADFDNALEINPDYTDARENREIVLDMKGQSTHKSNIEDYTIGVLSSEIETSPEFAEAYLLRGLAYEAKGLYDQAVTDYTIAIEIDPKLEDAYLRRGDIYFNQQHYDKSIWDFTETIKLNQESDEAYNSRGLVYTHKGFNDKAIADFNRATKLNPNFAEAFYNRGNAHSNKGNYDLAILDFTKAIELEPDMDEAYYNRANCYQQQDLYVSAIEDYTQAIQLNPQFGQAYENRGAVYMIYLGNKNMACDDWKRACELGWCKNYELSKKRGDCD